MFGLFSTGKGLGLGTLGAKKHTSKEEFVENKEKKKRKEEDKNLDQRIDNEYSDENPIVHNKMANLEKEVDESNIKDNKSYKDKKWLSKDLVIDAEWGRKNPEINKQIVPEKGGIWIKEGLGNSKLEDVNDKDVRKQMKINDDFEKTVNTLETYLEKKGRKGNKKGSEYLSIPSEEKLRKGWEEYKRRNGKYTNDNYNYKNMKFYKGNPSSKTRSISYRSNNNNYNNSVMMNHLKRPR